MAKRNVKVKSAPKPIVKKAVNKPATKMDLCDGWMSDNPGKPRKEIIKIFQDKFGLTKAGSSTYYAILKKRLNYLNKAR